MEKSSPTFLIPRLQQVMQRGILVDCYSQEFPREICGINRILPCFYLILIHRGTAEVVYDSRVATMVPNMVVLVHPGHMVRFIDRTDDLVYSRLIVTPQLFEEMLTSVYYHNVQVYHNKPGYILSDEQVKRLMAVMELLAAVAGHDNQEIPHRRQLLLSQLAFGYELLNYYRLERDKDFIEERETLLLKQFCDLVVAHYRESREVQYYADLMNLTPKQLAKIIRAATGGTAPSEWIEQYVITQAKQMMEFRPSASLTEIAYTLGFSEPSAFFRYFKRSTGMTAKEYRLKGGNSN